VFALEDFDAPDDRPLVGVVGHRRGPRIGLRSFRCLQGYARRIGRT
jgi:hypothetical protein